MLSLKLSIYPETDSETILLDTPSPLEHQIGKVRRKITEAIGQARDEGQGIVNKWIGVEQAVESAHIYTYIYSLSKTTHITPRRARQIHRITP